MQVASKDVAKSKILEDLEARIFSPKILEMRVAVYTKSSTDAFNLFIPTIRNENEMKMTLLSIEDLKCDLIWVSINVTRTFRPRNQKKTTCQSGVDIE